jgi:methionine-rich copper-binding protein CopC
MGSSFATFARRRFSRRQESLGWAIESAELRCLLSAAWPTVSEFVPNDTLDLAVELFELRDAVSAQRTGVIGDSEQLEADVDWYQFTLEQASRVTISAKNVAGNRQPPVALSLFNSTPFEFDDPFNRLGHRLLVQAEATGKKGAVQLERLLGPGTYFVAVSGAGNLEFHPFLAGSGLAGETADYLLTVTHSSLNLSSDNGPVVLWSEPSANSKLTASPQAVRIGFGTPLDPGSISPDENVVLTFSTNARFGDDDDQPVALAMVNYSYGANELQLFPAAPLGPGYYRVFLGGNSEAIGPLSDENGIPLGATQKSPQGRDYSFGFQITGIEGRSADFSGDDTVDTARDLGDITKSDRVQVSGVIGDDPFYDPNLDWELNPANDVDMYRFVVTGEGQFALLAEVFAGRIGSPLDPGISLYRRNPADGSVQFVAGNNNSSNTAVATNDTLPLFTDPVLFVGLTAGEYFVVVAGAFNTPSPFEGQPVDADGVLDPTVSHSGRNGETTGRYVLYLRVEADNLAPTVKATSLTDGTTLEAPPTRLTITFSEPINLQALANQAFHEEEAGREALVFVQNSQGTRFVPRFESFDPATNQVTLLMLDALPKGRYELHLAGSAGLTDLGGNPLEGNDPSGDYVVRFKVSGTSRGSQGSVTDWLSIESNDDWDSAQDLGALFPNELIAGVTISRRAAGGATDVADHFRFELLQNREYVLGLTGNNLPTSMTVAVLDQDGNVVQVVPSHCLGACSVTLGAGTHGLAVSGWDATDAAQLEYTLSITLPGFEGNPPPLSGGPAPALQLRLAGTAAVVTSPPAIGAVTTSQLGNGSSGSNNPAPSPSPNTTIPTTSLAAFSERPFGGVGGHAPIIASSGDTRTVLRLPEVLEWVGSSELVFQTTAANVRERRLQNDDEQSTTDSVPDPETGEAESSSNNAANPKKSTSPDKSKPTEAEPGAEKVSGSKAADDTDPKDVANEKSPRSSEATNTTQEKQADVTFSEAGSLWLPALAAMLSARLSKRGERNAKLSSDDAANALRRRRGVVISTDGECSLDLKE